jgi:hypothetical protein
MLLSAIFMFSSCFLGNSDDNVVTYDDSAISSFSLGTLNRHLTTKSSTGADSIYKTTISCSSYAFTIDQENKQIFNLDSLPYGTDPTKVVFTASTKNSGVVFVKSLTSDSVSYYSSDSIDFTKPRTIVVYSSSGKAYRDYVVTVNIHQELDSVFTWNGTTIQNASLALLKAMKGVACNGKVFVFGNDGSSAKIFAASESNAASWSDVTPNVTLDVNAYKGVVSKDNLLYVYNNGSVLSSPDAVTWTTVSTPTLKQLVGVSDTHLYAVTADNKIMSSADNGKTWAADELDTDGSMLPTANLNFVSLPLETNVKSNRLILLGTTSTDTHVWGKIEENASSSESQPWSYYPIASENKYLLPNMENIQAIAYNGCVLAIGGKGFGNSTNQAFAQFYTSSDKGLTWQNDTTYTFPKGFTSSNTVFTMVKDSKNFIWLICGQSGQVWHGRLNMLGWADDKRYFKE